MNAILISLFLTLPLQDVTPPGEVVQQDPSDSPTAGPESPPLEVRAIQLRNGSLHWAQVVEHDDSGLLLRRIENGGLVRISWNLLEPRQAERLRIDWGYVSTESAELLIEVDRLILHNGSEVLGVIENREGADFTVRHGGNIQIVPKRAVKNLSSGVQVPALSIYSREQLYSREAAQTDLTDPVAHNELALFCERILDFQSAVRHYEGALELGIEDGDGQLVRALDRAKVKAALQEQVDYLHQTEILQRRGQFDVALERVEKFPVTFPGSPLQKELARTKMNILQARERALLALVRRSWNIWAQRLSRKAASGTSFEAATGYASEKLGQDIRAAVLKDAQELASDLDLEQLDVFWIARARRRYSHASYGNGTWLLGEDRALAGTPTQQGNKPSKGGGEKDAERAALEQKIKRFLENQKRARRARSSADEADSFQTGWAELSGSSRAQWLLAFYIEFSGDYELNPRPHLRKCSTCAGRGVLESIGIGGRGEESGGVQIEPCSVCHGIGSVRRIDYR
jgi:tetratricopeptide (TPR) repeat protein